MREERDFRFLEQDAERWKETAQNWKVLCFFLIGAIAFMALLCYWHNQQGTKSEVTKNEVTKSALSSFDYGTRYTSSIAHAALEDAVRIPVVLNASCTFWVDQYGDLMSIADANAFFAENRDIAFNISQLNANPYYATELYSSERNEFLDESYSIWYDAWDTAAREATGLHGGRTYDAFSSGICTEISNVDQWKLYFRFLADCVPNGESLYRLKERLGYNYASHTIENILRDRGTQQVASYGSNPSERLFFACLAKFNEDGTMDTLHDRSSDRIPLVLTADGTWYDQYGEAMDAYDAHRYFDAHPGTKNRVYTYNLSFNPYLVDNVDLPAVPELESLYDELYEGELDDNHEDSYLCYRAVEELLTETPPDDESVAVINAFLGGRGIFYYSETTAINQATQTIAELADPQADLQEIYGRRNKEDYSAELFVLALYRMNDTTPLKPYLAKLRVTYNIEDSLEAILAGYSQSTSPRKKVCSSKQASVSEKDLELTEIPIYRDLIGFIDEPQP